MPYRFMCTHPFGIDNQNFFTKFYESISFPTSIFPFWQQKVFSILTELLLLTYLIAHKLNLTLDFMRLL